MLKIRFALFGLLMLGACAATGPTFDKMTDNDLDPKPDQATLVIYRPHSVLGIAKSFWVEVDGKEVCDSIHDAGYIVHKRKPGTVTVTSSSLLSAGTTRKTFHLLPGSLNFVSLELKEARAAISYVGMWGYVANGVMEGVSPVSGPLYINAVSAWEAMAEIKHYKKEKDCY